MTLTTCTRCFKLRNRLFFMCIFWGFDRTEFIVFDRFKKKKKKSYVISLSHFSIAVCKARFVVTQTLYRIRMQQKYFNWSRVFVRHMSMNTVSPSNYRHVRTILFSFMFQIEYNYTNSSTVYIRGGREDRSPVSVKFFTTILG